MYTQRLLLIILALTCGGLVAAPPRGTGLEASAVARVSFTIPPRVKLARVHNLDLEFHGELTSTAHSDSLCIVSTSRTEYSVTAEGRSDIELRSLTGVENICSSGNGYALNVPLDSVDSDDFGNPLTLIVAAE